MKEKVIKLDNNQEMYILDELNYMNRKFAFGFFCDNKNGILKDNYSIIEAKVKDGDLYFDNVQDFSILSTVSNLFLARMQAKQKEA